MANAFALACRLLSILPPLSWQPPTRAEARRAVALFPLVGALLGLLTACAWNFAARLWGSGTIIPAAVALAVDAALSGGRPLGGIGRAGDGLAAHGAGGERSRAFAVMRDPRRGTAGMVALAVTVALKLAFLSGLPPPASWAGLVLVGALGRWSTAFGLAAFPLASASVTDPEVSHGLTDAGLLELLAATMLAVLCAALLPVRGMMILIATLAVVGGTASAVHQRLGGLSLPLAQALGTLGELTALACLALHLP